MRDHLLEIQLERPFDTPLEKPPLERLFEIPFERPLGVSLEIPLESGYLFFFFFSAVVFSVIEEEM